MAKYRVFIKPSALKELEAVARKKDRQRLVRRIQNLGGQPRPPGSQKLSGRALFRVRQGNYRIVYEVKHQELTILIVKVGDRKQIYPSR